MRTPTLVLGIVLALPFLPLLPEAEAAGEIVRGYYAPGGYGYDSYYWAPSDLTVVEGDTVEFRNGAGTHSFASQSGLGGCAIPCTVAFTIAGDSNYICGIHGSRMSGVVHVLDRPYVLITSPTAFSTLSGVVEVVGSAQVIDGTITSVKILVDGVERGFATLSGSPGSPAFRFNLDSRSMVNGPRIITAVATSSRGPTGELALPVTASNPEVPDLVMTGFQSRTMTFGSSITFTMTNAGNVNPGSHDILLTYLYHGSWRPIATIHQNGIAPGQLKFLTYEWVNPLFVGSFEGKAVADPSARLVELSEGNNERGGPIVFTTSAVPGIDPREP